ncbi:MAG: ThiF family adenylyltransferase [Deltaproteobacteria bacterium]|nr:ThiF family adenylyltransferase [Deltaproteobacteria bacterium]
MPLTEADAGRYARHASVAAVGAEGQARLRAARVQVVGAGGEAGPALLCLAQAGVGALYLDDEADVGPEDAPGWLYGPERLGELRLLAALEPLRRTGGPLRVRPHGTGVDLSAALIFAGTRGIALLAADRARLAALPHVVVEPRGEGGRVVSVPAGAPCYRCAGRPVLGGPPAPGAAAAAGLLGALELLLILADALPPPGEGRCLELGPAGPQARATVRRSGCACGRPPA